MYEKSKNSYLKKLLFPDLRRGVFLSVNCPICNQETERSGAEYCLSHLRALESVRLAFEKWTVAFENLILPDFLERVQRAPGIGSKAKEVARFLSENPSRWKL